MFIELATAVRESSPGPQQHAPCLGQAKLVLAKNNSSLPPWMERAYVFVLKVEFCR